LTLPGQNVKFSHGLPVRASGLEVIIARKKYELFLLSDDEEPGLEGLQTLFFR
jgi:hypothetical protein